MKTANDTLIINGPENSPWTSLAQHVGYTAAYSIQIKCLSGTVTIKLQCSTDMGNHLANTETGQAAGVKTWTDIIGSSQVLNAGDDVTYDASNLGYKWLRVVSTGAGVLETARINKKGF